ncbi:MAG: hypothetical protein PHT60_15065 [Acidiphilium sp.]|nr:hypothetical protein [Acidiphilium sp.]MDD4937083.1 hypothetical protein [Acidiphilium sp.]
MSPRDLTERERQIRLKALIRSSPNDPLLHYLVRHQERIVSILEKCDGDWDFILKTINHHKIFDVHGNVVALHVLKRSWSRVIHALEREEASYDVKLMLAQKPPS